MLSSRLSPRSHTWILLRVTAIVGLHSKPVLKVCNLPVPFLSRFYLIGSIGVLAKISDGTINGHDVVGAVITIAQVAEEKMGGTSGALYSFVVL
jgi:Na+/alanine symporter